MGHYANECPNRNKGNGKANVTFESAHVAKEGDESCKIAGDLPT